MSTDLAKKPVDGLTKIKNLLNGPDFKEQVAVALPKHMTPDRFVRIAINATLKNPKLLKCSQASLFGCLLELSQYGLEPDGRRAHLIPYGDVCTLVLDYKGIAELVMRSGLVSNIHADVVCDKDEFEYDRGQITRHKVNFREPRGEVYAAYAMIRFKDGTEKCEVMPLADIYAIRDRSQGWRAFKSGKTHQCPWDPREPVIENEMIKKTVFRRVSKWVPLSPEIMTAIERDDEDEARISEAINTVLVHRGHSKSDALAEEMANRLSQDSEAHDNEQNGDADDAPVSWLQDCRDWLESQMLEVMACNEDATVVKVLLNGSTLFVSEQRDYKPPQLPDTFLVDAWAADSLKQVQDVIAKLKKKASQ